MLYRRTRSTNCNSHSSICILQFSSVYELLDFGGGRKLERFGDLILDRPAPAADDQTIKHPSLWSQAHAVFQRRTSGGKWLTGAAGAVTENPADALGSWTVAVGRFSFSLKASPFGHLGVFPEQQPNWQWIHQQCVSVQRKLKILNLFAYSGGSSMAAAVGENEVVHVDAAKNMLDRTRVNLRASNLAEAHVRLIHEDARKFVDREVRRGNQYDALILDPPSYGHGPKGSVWQIEDHLSQLLEGCLSLTGNQPAFLLLSCHTIGYTGKQLQRSLQDAGFTAPVESGPMTLRTRDGRELPAGWMARITGDTTVQARSASECV